MPLGTKLRKWCSRSLRSAKRARRVPRVARYGPGSKSRRTVKANLTNWAAIGGRAVYRMSSSSRMCVRWKRRLPAFARSKDGTRCRSSAGSDERKAHQEAERRKVKGLPAGDKREILVDAKVEVLW